MDDTPPSPARLTTRIVTAFIAGPSGLKTELPAFIELVHEAVRSAESGIEAPPPHVKATRAQIRRSIGHDGLVSFENGRSYKALKPHLAALGMSFQDYRQKWGLPHDYPSACDTYRAMRSGKARSMGFGRGGAGRD